MVELDRGQGGPGTRSCSPASSRRTPASISHHAVEIEELRADRGLAVEYLAKPCIARSRHLEIRHSRLSLQCSARWAGACPSRITHQSPSIDFSRARTARSVALGEVAITSAFLAVRSIVRT